MKFCKDCRFFSTDWGNACWAPAIRALDPVQGPVPAYPATERGVRGNCGPEAKHFEPRLSLFQKLKRKFAA